MAYDLTGRVFGRLTAISFTRGSAHASRKWLCQCSCGNTLITKSQYLLDGLTRSCGCIRRPHGHTAGKGPNSKTYTSWVAMKSRCLSPKFKSYKDYGGRGITICERWLKFENFLADMGERPSGMTLERRDNNGNYEPDNCYWATAVEQMNNQRKTIRIHFQGQTKPAGTWAWERGMSRTTLTTRLARGWDISRAITEPVHSKS